MEAENRKDESVPGNAVLLLPRIVHLIYCLMRDRRVSGKPKTWLAGGLLYLFFPFDLIPEAIFPRIGYADDLLVLLHALRNLVADVDPEIVEEHWRGSQRELQLVRSLLTRGDDAVVGLWNRITREQPQTKRVFKTGDSRG